MAALVRFGVSLEKGLLDQFDRLLCEKGYSNRSEGIRDLIRGELVRKKWKLNEEVAGAITLVYDHHKRELLNTITDIQHDHQPVILSSQHVHLDHHRCLEIIAVKGTAGKIQTLADRLRAIKGVIHGSLAMTSAQEDLVTCGKTAGSKRAVHDRA